MGKKAVLILNLLLGMTKGTGQDLSEINVQEQRRKSASKLKNNRSALRLTTEATWCTERMLLAKKVVDGLVGRADAFGENRIVQRGEQY